MYMKDSMNTLFRQRFQGHESPVDPGLWQGIQAQLNTPPTTTDGVNELFKTRFQGHEALVDPAVWSTISGQLGHTAAAGVAASTLWTWVAAGVTAVAIATGALFVGTGERGTTSAVAVTEPEPTRQADPVAPPMSAPILEEAHAEPAQLGQGKNLAGSPKVRRGTKSPAQVVPVEPQPTVVTSQSTNLLDEGPEVVSEIIADLTKDVIQQPMTAQPEPGLQPTKSESAPATNAVIGATEQDPGNVATPPTPLAPLPKLFMPNTFTPNGDGVNDIYLVGTEGFRSAMIRVYSLKTNSLVFSTNTGEPWTGENCEDGMYMVAAEAQSTDGRMATEGKVVWLTRNPNN